MRQDFYKTNLMSVRIFLLFVILIFPSKGYCGEFGSWWQTTPEGNTIGKEKWNDQYIIGIICTKRNNNHLKYGHAVSNLKKWYFYKHHIIGEYLENSKQRFFIFNESNCEASLFDTQQKFDKQILEKKLQPKLWTRWYEKNWGYIITTGDFGEGMFFLFVKIPLIILIIILIVVNLFRTKFDFTKITNRFSLLLLSLIALRILFDIFSDSF